MDDPVPGKGKELTDVEDMKWCLPLEEEEEGADVGWWESSSSMPTPMDGLREPATPPFLTKTYEMVDDPATDPVVSWGRGQCTFVVRDPLRFSADLLPKHFKHNNFSSFLRQLNTYGFRKVDSERWEFANKGFLRGHKHLLKTIKRRRPGTSQLHHHHHHTGGGNGPESGLAQEIETLTRDRNVLMMDVLRLRQQQQLSRAQMLVMDEKIRSTESKQQYMMEFVSRALRISSFLGQKDDTMMIEDHNDHKRKRSLNDGAIIQTKSNAAAAAATHSYGLIANRESWNSISPISCHGQVPDQSFNSLALVGPEMIGHVDDHGGHHNVDDNWDQELFKDEDLTLPHEEEDRCDELAGIHTGLDDLMKINLDYWGEEADVKVPVDQIEPVQAVFLGF